MTRPGFATQQELLVWANSVGARTELPRLIRKLVLETARDLQTIDFPSAEGTAAGGWDGVSVASNTAPFVPAGQSLWELSVEKSVNAKADDDYSKRATTPDGRPTRDAAYIALSLRRWRDRREWARTKSEDKRWREVRAYGIDDVEAWLETAPITHAWISEQLGLKPYGLQTAEAWWAAWSTATDPSLSPELILAGRDETAQALRATLEGPPQIITVRGDSVDDVLAFVASLGVQDEAAGGGGLLARTAVVDDVGTWRALAAHDRPLILVPKAAAVVEEARSAPAHHVIVPLTGQSDADFELPPIDANAAKDALVTAGVDDESKADDVARLGRRSLMALRRHMAKKPELHTPRWATDPVDRVTRGLLLAGAWNDSAAGDQEVLSQLTGLPYDELREKLSGLAAEEDPLITRVGSTWTVVSPYDAWGQLRRKLRPDDLERLRSGVEQVLLEEDPTFGMPPEERWRAPAEGKVRRFSGDLRGGLASTIALLGALGDRVDAGHGASGVNVANSLVRGLLTKANEDTTGATWSGLSSHLPLLAEGAPDAFLEGVRAGLTGDTPVLLRIFQDDERSDPLFSSSPHTGLLWALEALAWSQDHFGQAISLLARLAEIDPGGRLSNRPARSLDGIYCPWHPETTATTSRRLDVLDAIRERHPDVAWELMISLLPEGHGVHFPTASPRFRDWKPSKIVITNLQYFEFLEGLVERLIADAGDVPARWQKLVDDSTHVSPTDRQRIREELKRRVEEGSLPEEGREALWDAMRKLIARHREFADADWALPEDELAALEAIEHQLAPAGTVEKNAWLFEHHMPDLGGSKRKDGEFDYAGYTAELQQRRDNGVREVEAQDGWDGVLRLAKRATSAWWVGHSLAGVDHGSHEKSCLPILDSEDVAEQRLSMGYFARRFAQHGWAWLDRLIADEKPNAVRTARLLLLTGEHPKSWQRADELGAEVAAEYWREFSPLGLGHGYPFVEETAARLIDAGRPGTALELISLYARDDETVDESHAVVAADALEALLRVDDLLPALQSLREYGLESIVGFLEKHRDAIGIPRVAQLEWAYLPALGHDPTTPSLHEALADDPGFFVQVLSAIYRADGDETTEVTEDQQNLGTNAYRLLSSWSRLPGLADDGQIDPEALASWVHTALAKLDEADRRAVGEIHIGHVLAYAPADTDGTWPCKPVRDLLEELQSEKVEQGFETQIFNNRGVTSRSPEAGGDLEHELAAKYRRGAEQLSDRWPRSAAILRSLASTYEQDARRQDDEAERRRTGIDP